ncbi:bifunctional lysine-specific demethylase and histidyl-hydroxylase NO66 [Drosophila biarmipes]|uniref:bifunctional lysine-specific demethylase and histidyl-hydroxylase NO66 n=1 Tax=Drosophila biarmipes TaxID=125945 RepID=UPI0007E8B24F|nr:bifunctional lysine-specific demethylase and histidyl-hydroxylase NO66 [Drosophila biarmipes]
MSEVELRVSKKSNRKTKDLSPACLDDLVNQVFDKSKQLRMSVKEQRKLVQEYLNAKIEDSDESEGQCVNDSDYDSFSDSGDDDYSDYEEETYSDEETEESSDGLESGSSEDEEGSPEMQGEIKNLDGKISKDEPELPRLVSYVGPPKRSLEPSSRIQRRMTMAGGLLASPIRNSVASTTGSPNQEKNSTSGGTKSLPV